MTYIRAAIYTVEEILPKVGRGRGKRNFYVIIDGSPKIVSVKMGSHRYQLFKEKGTVCVNCGLKGTYFALERHRHMTSNSYHFNLYGIDKNGNEVMLTKDHIVPKAAGGPNRLSNYQTMCGPCNREKADKL